VKKIFILLLSVFLSACQSGIMSPMIETQGVFKNIISEPSLKITQRIEVSPNSARAFLQNGEPISMGQLNLYDINCEIEINTVSELRQIINPGTFDIRAIIIDESPIVLSQPIRLAALNYTWVDNSPVDIKRYYRFRLSAREQASGSQVRSVTCRGVQDTPYEATLPTMEEMQKASGGYILFNL